MGRQCGRIPIYSNIPWQSQRRLGEETDKLISPTAITGDAPCMLSLGKKPSCKVNVAELKGAFDTIEEVVLKIAEVDLVMVGLLYWWSCKHTRGAMVMTETCRGSHHGRGAMPRST